MAAPTVNDLLNGATCYNSCIPDGMQEAVIIYLLTQLLAGGGGGGGGGGGAQILWIYWENTHADDNPPPNPAFSYMRRFRDGDNPVIWDPSIASWV